MSTNLLPQLSWNEIGRAAALPAPAMKPAKAKGGVCLSCGCTPEHPCDLANGDECQFLTADRDYCNSPKCARRAPKPAPVKRSKTSYIPQRSFNGR